MSASDLEWKPAFQMVNCQQHICICLHLQHLFLFSQWLGAILDSLFIITILFYPFEVMPSCSMYWSDQTIGRKIKIMFSSRTHANIWPLSTSLTSITHADGSHWSHNQTDLSPPITGCSCSKSHNKFCTNCPGGGDAESISKSNCNGQWDQIFCPSRGRGDSKCQCIIIPPVQLYIWFVAFVSTVSFHR